MSECKRCIQLEGTIEALNELLDREHTYYLKQSPHRAERMVREREEITATQVRKKLLADRQSPHGGGRFP